MTVQTMSLLLSAAAILLLAAVFLRVRALAHAVEDYAPVQGRAYRMRAIAFWLMVLVGLPISIWLLRDMPYKADVTEPQIVNATAAQWYWELDREEVSLNRPVEFRVASMDVNHGFGIYDAAGRLVAQTQAMPGYVNRLVHEFDAPGTYRVLCLEYCGLAHHGMLAEVIVSQTGGNDG